jgi:acetyltransferase/esterase
MIYREVHGTGDVLLLIPGGNGDAGPYGPLSRLLSDRFTVVSYDRRGFSRSTIDEVPADRMTADIDDAIALIDAAGVETAHIFGSSSGAIVALELLSRHPDRVATLVAHEPPLMTLLPDRDHWLAITDQVYATFRREGPAAAMAEFGAGSGVGVNGEPPDPATLPPQAREMFERMVRNQSFWLEYEIRQYPRLVPDLKALAASRSRIVLAGGDESHDSMPYKPNLVLAEQLGLSVVDFPGDHIGYVTRPSEFAPQLGAILEA